MARICITRSARAWGGVAAVTCALAVSACGSSSSSSSSASGASTATSSTSAATAKASCPINALMVANTTGAGSDNGIPDAATAKLAISQINKSGGVLGCPIKLTVEDDASDYTQDIPITQKALSSGTKYSLIMEADYGCAETAPLVSREKILEISACGLPGFSNPTENPTLFDTLMTSDRQGAAAATYMHSKGCSKIAVVTDNTALGTGEYDAMVKAVGSSAITAHEGLNLSGINFTPAILAARASNPTCLYFDVFGAAAGHFLNDLRTSGWKIPTYFGPTVAATNLQQIGVPQSQADKLIGVQFRTGAYPSSPAITKWYAELKAAGVNTDLNALSYTGYHDSLYLFKWAADHTQSLNGTVLAHTLETSGSTSIPGLLTGKSTGFSTACHQFVAPLAVVRGGYYKEARLKLITTIPTPNLPCPKAVS